MHVSVCIGMDKNQEACHNFLTEFLSENFTVQGQSIKQLNWLCKNVHYF